MEINIPTTAIEPMIKVEGWDHELLEFKEYFQTTVDFLPSVR